ncbi:lysophospholipid acyltransferase family protein [Stigmatella erecta]|uniref:1-acyl-sn-glycerol-3-phosphate acyltransferase n=1 Tax=Stigmatella erecta TaxID=83460 RepID=A0A1H9ZIF2_9BACT|nr:lysophospholipid acyltransferase family protein [Stigmatella erecta]SES80855.1 1-acyl-sn-glycerol-3-phosphate acyltransferase [Stigmatella erecta]
MATKGVLGNDPFQRGAAQRSTEPQSPAAEAPKAAASKKAASPRSKAPGTAKKAAPAKAAAPKAAKPPKAAPKAAKPPRERKPARTSAPAQQMLPRLREPASPEVPRRPLAEPLPEVAASQKAVAARAAREREVDGVMATAPALEATQAAAEAAAETAVATLLTLGAQQALEGTAPAPNSLEATWNRELATAVVAEAAEATAEAVLGVALSAQAPGGQEEEETRDVAGPSALPSAEAEDTPEEVPDPSQDEFPPARKAPLSLVPAPEEPEAAQEESFSPEQLQAEQVTATPPPGSVFALAKEIVFQALSSASMGRTLEAAHGVVNTLRAGLGTHGSTSLDEYGRDPELVSELQPLLDFLYERYWRVTLQSVDMIPAGGAILVANHSGALPFDGLVVTQAILRERPELREPRWLVEDQIFHAPVLGTIFNRLGAVRACPENALRLLDEQRPVLVFPEGYQGLSKPFAQRYQLKRFGRGGFVKLALRTGAPIIPVAIVGSEETSPLLGRIPAGFLGVPYLPLTGPLPLPAKWTLRFGEPISMEGLSQDAANDLAEVQRLTERTRESIQGMLQALLRERRSVFAG